MSAPIIRGWAYAFDDDRSPPVTKQRAEPIDADVFVVPAPSKHHCAYCHTVLDHKANSYQVCDAEACRKKQARDINIKRLDRAQQQAGGGIVQRGKNRQ